VRAERIDRTGASRLDGQVPDYTDLRVRTAIIERMDDSARVRTIDKLLELRKALAQHKGAPPPRQAANLLIGTWNLREFDSSTWGERLPETYAYISEIISHFDLIAVQEVRSNLKALTELMRWLGPDWKYLVSDVTRGRAGNQERLAFLYDTTKVRFLGVAGELVLPPLQKDKKDVPAQQVARTPLMAAFQAGWTKFVLATVHIVYGDKRAAPPERVEEIRQVARFLRDRTEDTDEPTRNLIVLGDFNIFSEGDDTMKALTVDGGFSLPKGVTEIPGTNVPRNKKYDQIAFRANSDYFESTGLAGAFDYYEHVMTADESATYRPFIDKYIADRAAAGEKSPKPPADADDAVAQYKEWRTYQMSDHLPLWAEFRVDFADEYLTSIR
jgi:endonuclease/exonuclease/phosphatase family metal-dependent hydrolase